MTAPLLKASEQNVVCGGDSGKVPETSSVPKVDTLSTKPRKQSALKINLDVTPMEEIVVLEPLALSVPDGSLVSRPMAGNINWNPVKHLVHVIQFDRRTDIFGEP